MTAMKKNKSILFCAALLAPAAAHAQYFGGIDFMKEPPALVAPVSPFFITSTALDDGRLRYGLRLGYRLNPLFSVESHYASLDRKAGTLVPDRRYGLDLTSRVTLWDKLHLSGSVGAARLHRDAGPVGNGVPSISYLGSLSPLSANVARIGVGMSYQVTDSLGLRLDLERYRALGGANIGAFSTDNVSFGVSLRF
ncbi:MAG: outer membrane beta-barrel protein [Betaproteobacteria bacterium]|nr:outer membrane beta-barrel protein [Betaproteobacteria bacterium]